MKTWSTLVVALLLTLNLRAIPVTLTGEGDEWSASGTISFAFTAEDYAPNGGGGGFASFLAGSRLVSFSVGWPWAPWVMALAFNEDLAEHGRFLNTGRIALDEPVLWTVSESATAAEGAGTSAGEYSLTVDWNGQSGTGNGTWSWGRTTPNPDAMVAVPELADTIVLLALAGIPLAVFATRKRRRL